MIAACSDAHTIPLSNALDITISLMACLRSAVFSMYAGTLPAPTPSAGLPQEYAALTIALPPVARIVATPGWFINLFVLSKLGCSIHEIQCAGAPEFMAASLIIRAASKLDFCAFGWNANIIGFLVLIAMSALNIVVDVGFVTGVIAAITPTGSATSVIPVTLFSEIIPTVFKCLI